MTSTGNLRILVWPLSPDEEGGEWVDIEPGDDAEFIQAKIEEVMENPDAEWQVMDSEGFGNLGRMVTGSVSCEYLAGFAAAYGWTLDEETWRAFLLFTENLNMDEVPDEDNFRDSFEGVWDNAGDWVADMEDSIGDIPERLVPYVDYEKMARDMVYGGEITVENFGDGRVVIFRNW